MNTIFPNIIFSDDGSATLTHPIVGDTYHSTSGAIGESLHVYIENGLQVIAQQNEPVKILEMGFGSGLNFLLTVDYALQHGLVIDYTTVELYPVDMLVIENMGYCRYVSQTAFELFLSAHRAAWNESVVLGENIVIHKIDKSLLEVNFARNDINLVYFDAFAPDTQPELWSESVFEKIFRAMSNGGVLVTYSAKGTVKQALRAVGFNVQRKKGALGKHHQLVCTKL